jgi:hypothetical protein
MRRPAIVTAVAFCCTLFLVSVAVPAFGGPTALSPTAVAERTNSALAHAKRADKRALRAYRRATTALRELRRQPAVRVQTLAGPAGPPGPPGTPARDDGVIQAKVIYRALNASPPQVILNTGTFGLRALCDQSGMESLQYITNTDHSVFSMNAAGVQVNKPDFRKGTVGNVANPGTGVGTLAYTEPAHAGQDGQTVTMTFTSNDEGSVDTDTSAPTLPFGGTTQVACELDGIVQVAP